MSHLPAPGIYETRNPDPHAADPILRIDITQNPYLSRERYAPGCGAPTRVTGTNGGSMRCGALLHSFGTVEPYFCAACQERLHEQAKRTYGEDCVRNLSECEGRAQDPASWSMDEITTWLSVRELAWDETVWAWLNRS